MKKYLVYIIFPVLSAILFGCETEATDIRVPEFEQKLVVTGFISPSDDISYFSVSSNWELYGVINTKHSVGNLKGTITDGINTALLDTCRIGLKLDQKKLKIEYGKTYHLKIENDHGLAAEAACQVPEKRDFIINLDTAWTTRKYSWDNEKTLKLKIAIRDNPGEKNYYTVEVTGGAWGRTPLGSHFGVQVGVEPGYLIKSDKGFDGEEINWEADTGLQEGMDYDSASYKICLYHTEESYFLYHSSLFRYEHDSNPFAEATPVYSNIKNGLGVFTSYTVDSVIFRLK